MFKRILGIGAFLLVFGAVFGGIWWLVYQSAAPLQTSINTFFGLVVQHEYQEAYDSTASGFQQNTTEPQFEAIVAQQNLDQYVKSSFPDFDITDATGRLDGTITLKNGHAISMEVEMMKEDGQWKVFGLNSSGGMPIAVPTQPPAPPDLTVPSDADSAQLAKVALILFAQSVKAKDFKLLYVGSSQKWQAQTSIADLDSAYASFINSKLDFSGLITQPIVLSGTPMIDDNGELVVDGTVADVPAKGDSFVFKATFVQEYDQWRLFGLAVSVKNK
ncbi:MAG: hypothetical protein WA001_04075 [Patescibacteria group bacterium]